MNFFCVEDMLKSFPAVKVAADMIQKIKLFYGEGGFNLTKFSSSHVGFFEVNSK